MAAGNHPGEDAVRAAAGFRGPTRSIDEAMRDIQTVNLLSKAQLRELFPDGRIVQERFSAPPNQSPPSAPDGTSRAAGADWLPAAIGGVCLT